MEPTDEKILIENINTPGKTSRVNRDKYNAMKTAMLKVLPACAPGFTQQEIRDAILPHLDDQHFPAGATSGWWAKTVQLDLEAKGILIREPTRPLRWHRIS